MTSVLGGCGQAAPGPWRCDARAGVETCTRSVAADEREPAPWKCRDVAGGRMCTAPRSATATLGPRYTCRVSGELRVCVDRAPARPDARARYWRCWVERDRRTCRARGSTHGPWLRDPGGGPAVWSQRRYALPDEDEWECAEIKGISYCRTTGAAAGVARRAPLPFWICGDGPEGRRICTDPDPDRPADVQASLACHFDHSPPRRRWCETKTMDDGACRADADCGGGALCIESRCAPLVSELRCYFDRDCGEGAGQTCRWGECLRGGANP